MPMQSCGQSVSAPRGKAGARLNALTELRTKSALGAGSDITCSAYLCLALCGGTGYQLATASADRTMALWDVRKLTSSTGGGYRGALLASFGHGFTHDISLCFIPNQTMEDAW
jgi:WD40 repeat protein